MGVFPSVLLKRKESRMRKKSDKVFSVIDTGIFDSMVLFSCGFSCEELIQELKAQNCEDWVECLKNDSVTLEHGDYWALKRLLKEKKATYTYFYIFFSQSV